MIRAIIFDFDGTIADTYDAFVEIVNDLSAEFGYRPVSSEELARLKQLSSQEILQQSELSPVQIPFFLRKVKHKLNKKIDFLPTFPSLSDCLKKLKSKDYILGIVTSNHKDNVESFLRNNDLTDLFDFVYSGITLFGKHKIINRIIKKYDLKPEQVVYVGDETRDIIAAKKSKVRAVAVSWGFNDYQILSQHQPDLLIGHPLELVEALTQSLTY